VPACNDCVVCDRSAERGARACRRGVVVDASLLVRYWYDGNRCYVNAANNQLAWASGGLTRTYSYDAAGNTLSYGGPSFTYNNRGRMMATSASSTDYLYNALGQLVEKSGTLGTTVLMYDESGHLIGEYDGSGNLIEETVWLADIPVATLQPNGSGGINIFYIHTARPVLRRPSGGARPRVSVPAGRGRYRASA
jgi:YD repeat-containing protein